VRLQQIKEKMDAKFGGPFHCVCGQTFGFRVTHEVHAAVINASCDRSSCQQSVVCSIC
jgi:Dynein light chain type 1